MRSRELHSDLELVRGCKKNKRKFQEILYNKYARKMYGICLSYAQDRAEAQDILQDGFVKVFKKMHTFKEEGSLEGWVRKIIVNTALDYMRSKTKRYKFIDENKEVEAEEGLDSSLLDKINTDALLERIARLPKGARAVFNLYAVEGYSHEEIAEKLNISTGTSKSQYKRARSLLKNLIKDII